MSVSVALCDDEAEEAKPKIEQRKYFLEGVGVFWEFRDFLIGGSQVEQHGRKPGWKDASVAFVTSNSVHCRYCFVMMMRGFDRSIHWAEILTAWI